MMRVTSFLMTWGVYVYSWRHLAENALQLAPREHEDEHARQLAQADLAPGARAAVQRMQEVLAPPLRVGVADLLGGCATPSQT